MWNIHDLWLRYLLAICIAVTNKAKYIVATLVYKPYCCLQLCGLQPPKRSCPVLRECVTEGAMNLLSVYWSHPCCEWQKPEAFKNSLASRCDFVWGDPCLLLQRNSWHVWSETIRWYGCRHETGTTRFDALFVVHSSDLAGTSYINVVVC